MTIEPNSEAADNGEPLWEAGPYWPEPTARKFAPASETEHQRACYEHLEYASP